MDKLKQVLASTLEDVASRYGWVLKADTLGILLPYFYALERVPHPLEILTCLGWGRSLQASLPVVKGHTIDAFYAQPTILKTSKPNLLDIPNIPSDVKPSHDFIEEKMLSEEEAIRARTLMASSTRLPPEVVSILEDRYWVENHFTSSQGYHHYEHVEGESCYSFFFNRLDRPGSFSARAGFIAVEGPDLKSMAGLLEKRMRDANQAGLPLLCTWFQESNTMQCIGGGFSNVLPTVREDHSLKPGDQLFLLGQPSQPCNRIVENQFQSVLFNAYALQTNNPIFEVFYLNNQSLIAAILDGLRSSEPGSGVQVRLNVIPTPNANWVFEDFWVKSLPSSCLVVVPGYQTHIFRPIVEREGCPCIEIGQITELESIVFFAEDGHQPSVDLSKEFLENLPMVFSSEPGKDRQHFPHSISSPNGHFSETLETLLQSASISDKGVFLTQMDRTATGLVARDALIGPWQVPVGRVSVTATEFKDYGGEAMAMSVCAAESKDLASEVLRAFNEVMVHLSAAAIQQVSDVRLMVSGGPVSIDLQHQLNAYADLWNIACHYDQIVPSEDQRTCFFTAFAPVIDVRKTLTPKWIMDTETELAAVLWEGKSIQGWQPFFSAIQTLNRDDLLLAYHGLSEGGLTRCLLEMAFSSHCGFSVNLGHLSAFEAYSGAVIQVSRSNRQAVTDFLAQSGFEEKVLWLGRPVENDEVAFRQNETILFSGSRVQLHRIWSLPGYELQNTQGDPLTAREAYDALLDARDLGLHETLTFNSNENIVAPYMSDEKPAVAILRFPGGQGYLELAAAFDRVGFECIDVSILDIVHGKEDLASYVGLAVGGIELGEQDRLTAAALENDRVRMIFERFFHQKHTFTLGTGNGCQWLTYIKDWIPGAAHWPSFQQNASGQFESRWSLVGVKDSNSVFLRDMAGSFIPLPVACQRGRCYFSDQTLLKNGIEQQHLPLAFANHQELITEQYPFNPTGTPVGVCAFTNQEGRVLGIMGHPERAFRAAQQGWRHRYLQGDAPWLRLFRNARHFVGGSGSAQR